MIECISINTAARIMHKDPIYIRVGLQQNTLPFGSAVKISDKRFSYHISPQKFADYMGLTIKELEEHINERHI